MKIKFVTNILSLSLAISTTSCALFGGEVAINEKDVLISNKTNDAGDVIHITIVVCKGGDIGNIDFAKMNLLQSIDINSRFISRDSFRSMQKISSKLSAFSMTDTIFDMQDLTVFLKSHREIKDLTLSRTNLNDEVLQEISKMKIRSLYISQTKISDSGIVFLQNINELSSLDVSENAITNKSVDCISRISSLKKLSMRKTLINDDAIPMISRMRQLFLLHINGTEISTEGKRKITESVPRLILQ